MGKQADVKPAERREAVLALIKREESAEVLARRYGVSAQTLYRWRDDFLAAGDAALAGPNGKGKDPRDEQIRRLEKEVARRDQVIGELTIANRLFKKLSDGSL
ncbi:MAG: helix-turn-helix domain-containing protein [Planctomycetales bacterium]|nr:helix-turn-helix domain-containing protein [Planctomycetales bacterium]